MQKATAFLFAVLVLGAIALVVVPRGRGGSPSTETATADAGAPSDAGAATAADGGAEPSDAGASGEPGSEVEPAGPVDAGGTLLLTGEAPPPLAGEVPKSVVFGVILVQYKGAQGALPNARPREEALTLAKQLAEEAKTDFKAAVAKGDKGSMENAGRLPRGILEPAPEYVLFSLAKGAVSEVVDTPRGYWIVTRIE
ncbi:peptidylprolyl isomerase [Polyangium jinanense]|uniref:Peptidylprolyl isomerase n=1 Tax=Polyangium jinanense TaxID=2829994 RepID=A0A9X4AU22_9BACT|nr:peptidylprolyl isomerase [Polyangium jinanense]MDC3956736.1 peptidylprolyl isomerase [Polyangium jinanense]MDC3984799.1 peptidylprolyl isomerase [Polyangium jinanense]